MRYREYIDKEIPNEYIAPYSNLWANDILDLIPSKLPNVDKIIMDSMLNDMLLEIQHDYFESMRKAILDYVLKDE
jgi:hypothetical protein